MWQGYLQILLTLVIVIIITPLLGSYIAKVFLGEKTLLDSWLNPIETILYQWIQVRPQQAMTGWQYVRAILYSNLVVSQVVIDG
ncbi:MAG: potassium-transporting ATPase subunit KdpA [Synechocystis sp.]